METIERESLKSLIKKLVETVSPSGFESQIREVIRAEVTQYADEVSVDHLGNLIVRKGNVNGGGKKIMLVAHMDEIGVMATHIDQNGFIRFLPLGGVRPYTCVGGRVRFLDGTTGVIGVERLEDAARLPTIEQMFIDIGVADRNACPVKVGDVAAFDRPFADLGKRLVSKAMDDRIGVAVLIEALARLSKQDQSTPHQIFFVFSVQEEVGVRGATAAAFGLDPEVGLAVDVTLSADTPKAEKMEVGLGKGPAIKVRDSGLLADPRLVKWMVSAAEKIKAPYQLEVLERGGTDAQAIQLTRAGVPSGCLSIPCRYVHAPSEMVDFDDVQHGIALLVELMSHPLNLI